MWKSVERGNKEEAGSCRPGSVAAVPGVLLVEQILLEEGLEAVGSAQTGWGRPGPADPQCSQRWRVWTGVVHPDTCRAPGLPCCLCIAETWMWQMGCSVDKELPELHPKISTALCTSGEQRVGVFGAPGWDQSDLTPLR